MLSSVLLLTLVASAATSSSASALEPWKAAKSVLDYLPAGTHIRSIDSNSINVRTQHNYTPNQFLSQVYCGQKIELGVQLDGRLYNVVAGMEIPWERLGTPQLQVTPYEPLHYANWSISGRTKRGLQIYSGGSMYNV